MISILIYLPNRAFLGVRKKALESNVPIIAEFSSKDTDLRQKKKSEKANINLVIRRLRNVFKH
jgi:hypothetical protein